MPRRQPAFPIVPVVVLAALLMVLAGVLIARSGNSSAPSAPSTTGANGGFDGAPLPAVAAPPLRLADLSGRPVALSDYRGRVVVLTFLYPGCGATCTVIAQQIRGALDELPSPVPVVIVSADPAADSPAAVSRFLKSVSLSGRAVYLTGAAAELKPVWSAYRVRPVACRTHFVCSHPQSCQAANDPESTEEAPVVLRSVVMATSLFSMALRDHIGKTGLEFSQSIMLLPQWLAIEMGWDFALSL